MVVIADNVVTLTDEQMGRAARVAAALHDRLRGRGVRDGHGAKKGDITREDEAGGAQAELALSIYLGVAWTAGEAGSDQFGPDVGNRTQVRSSNKHHHNPHLIVREKDVLKYGNVPFVLVIQKGNRFELRGWAMCFDVINYGRLSNGGDSSRPDAWFVPESQLKPIETLDEA